MIYQLRIDCYADNQQDFDDVLDKLNDLKPDLKVIHAEEPDQQCSTIDLIENHHDQTPPGPCYQISHWDNCPD